MQQYLHWIETEYSSMLDLLEKWVHINSFSTNLSGLAEMLSILQKDFSVLEGEATIHRLPHSHIVDSKGQLVDSPVGQALTIKKRGSAPIQVCLGGHMDTVYSPQSSFQRVTRVNSTSWKGPGVADMKGGLLIMLKALEAFERSPLAEKIGWEIILNADEEIGSPGSTSLFKEAALRNHVGLVFEPSFSDGSFVSARKGTANYTIVIQGRSAHAGRDFELGRSAIYAMSHIIQDIEALNDLENGTTVNVGIVSGGETVNTVPNLAICRLNIRTKTIESMEYVKKQLHRLISMCKEERDGIRFTITEETMRPPKLFDKKNQLLFQHYEACAKQLKLPFQLKESGGGTDGSILSAIGLPTFDSAGPIGGDLHTDNEFIFLPSLVQRSQLAALFLLKLAAQEIKIEKEAHHV